MKRAAKLQAKTAQEQSAPRPTIELSRIIVNGPDTTAFTGWGPKVSGIGNILKNWN